MLKLRKLSAVAVAVFGLLVLPSAAGATIASVFGGTVACTEQTGANAGQRWCGNSTGTTVSSFDGTPIDVSIGFPAASGEDKSYPVVGIYHGWGGTKIAPSATAAQRWLKLGYAVFSITDRGWGSSCGGPSKPANTVKAAPCEHGYIHLLSRRYEVRDVQTLLGKLADEGVINPQQIGATGGSYGGGMSLELGSLKDRVELPSGELIPWTSPEGKPMKISATAPEYPWSDIAQALQPNGSNLDYVENSPYSGMLGNHEYGIEKNNWNASLYNAGALLGYYGPPGDPEANITEWHNFNITGGPYNGKPLAIQQMEQLPNHSAYYTNLEEAPAPALMENGWNDDLFPADETVKYYNNVRAAYPNEPMELFDLDLGHNPRSASTPSTGDVGKLQAAQNEWFAHYVRGEGSEPSAAKGGATAITSFCPQTAGGSGTEYKAANWAALDNGEIDVTGAAEQTIVAPGTASANAFTSGTVCTTSSSADNASAATYKLPAASETFAMVGSPTVIAELSTPGENAQVIARLYDVNGTTEQLIGRAIYRPISPGGGFVKQVFQLHPQAWKVEAGHSLKLELLAQDSTYARNSSTPQSIQVKNLELRLPTVGGPGGDGGTIVSPKAPYLPPGYTLARNERTTVPGQPHLIGGSTPNKSGVFTLGWTASAAATALSYTLEHKNAAGGWSVVASGLSSPQYAFTAGSPEGEGTWNYRVTASDEGPASEPSEASSPVVVDQTAPVAPSASADRLPDYSGAGGWYKDTVTVSFASKGDPALSDGSPGSGLNEASLTAPQTFTASGSHTASGTVADNAGNTSSAGTLEVQVDATPPAVEVKCPATATVGSSAEATVTASDGQSGLATDPSGKRPIDTGKAAVVTTSATAVDNVGHETTGSCETAVGYPTPGAPKQTGGSNPSSSGLIKLTWAGADPMEQVGLSYTLQHRSALGVWTTVATGIEALSYEFTSPGESEGTWEYRVQGTNSSVEDTTAWSEASSAIVVDETAPNTPSVAASRAPDYAGGGGWYKDTVTASFSSNGDPVLADGSPGSGVDPSSIPSPSVFSTDGSHTASGTVADRAGNVSGAASLTVQVDATPPSLTMVCPATVLLHELTSATVSASDGQSGLASNPSGSVPIPNQVIGPKTITRTATDNVGHATTESCSSDVIYKFTNLRDGSGKIKQGKTVNVNFKASDVSNKPVSATATLEFAKQSSEETEPFQTAGKFNRQGKLAYKFQLNTGAQGMTKGTYVLRVTLDDGTRHTIKLIVR